MVLPRVRGEVGGGGIDCPPAELVVPVGGMRGMTLKFSLTGVLSRSESIGGLLEIVLAKEKGYPVALSELRLCPSLSWEHSSTASSLLDLPVKLGGVGALVPRLTA